MGVETALSFKDIFAEVKEGDAVLIDVRQAWEYEEEHIPDAVLIPLGELPLRVADVPDDKAVFVHCHLGGRSQKAVELLHQLGRSRAMNVEGGIEAWREAGLPTIRTNR